MHTLRHRSHGVRACDSESMPPGVDPDILHAVQTVYTSDLELPQEWTDAQRAGFIDAEADKMTWMARAHAATLADLSIRDWTRRNHGQIPDPVTQSALRTEARAQAVRQVLSTELYELIVTDDDR